MEKELEKKKKAIDASKNISTKENLEKEISLFNQDINKFRSEKDKILKNFEIKKKNEIDNFLIRVNPLIQEYMKDNSIDDAKKDLMKLKESSKEVELYLDFIERSKRGLIRSSG